MKLQHTMTYYDPAPLYCQYSGQSAAQDAYVLIDPATGEVTTDINYEVGNAVTSDIWHGLVKRVAIPNTLRADHIPAYVAEVIAIAEPACEGFETQWDGNNWVGVYPNWNEDTDAALNDIYNEWANDEQANWQVYDVADWLGNLSNAEIAELDAEAVEEDAEREGVILEGDIERYIAERREEMEETE